MSMVPYVIWGLTVFICGYIWRVLDPVVQTILNESSVTTLSLSFLKWMWNPGVLLIILIAPTVWLILNYQKSEYKREYRRT